MKIALIGAGGIAHAHSAAYLRLPNAEIVAVVDVQPEKAVELAARHSARAYPSLEAMFAAEKPGMVDICTPSDTHAAVALQCLERRVHVLCEKPIAYTLPQARALLRAARRSRVLLMIAQVIRFWPEYQFLRTLITEGTYGRLLQAVFTRQCGVPGGGQPSWYTDPARSGMAPFELHIHDVDYIYSLFGKPARVRSLGLERPDCFASYLRSSYEYPSGLLVEAEAAWYAGPLPFAHTYRAVFEGATLVFDSTSLLLYCPGESTPRQIIFDPVQAGAAETNLPSNDGIYNEIAYFLDCLATGQPPTRMPAEESVAVLQLMLSELRLARR